MAESTKNMTVGAGSASASVTATVTDQMPGVPCPATPGYTYTGMRYVPVFADPAEWSSANSYEPLEIVIHKGNSYTSKTFVPVGIDISDPQYWALTGNYNAQIEQYRQEVQRYSEEVTELKKTVSLTFDSIAEARVYGGFTEGQVVETLGYYSAGDGGGAFYKISATEPTAYYEIFGDVYGELIICEIMHIKQFGAVGNGLNDDTAALKNAISTATEWEMNGTVNGGYAKGGTIIVDPGTYLLTDTIYLNPATTLTGYHSQRAGVRGIGTTEASKSIFVFDLKDATKPGIAIVGLVNDSGIKRAATTRTYPGTNVDNGLLGQIYSVMITDLMITAKSGGQCGIALVGAVGISLYNNSIIGFNTSLYANASWYVNAKNCRFQGIYFGCELRGDVNQTQFENCTFMETSTDKNNAIHAVPAPSYDTTANRPSCLYITGNHGNVINCCDFYGLNAIYNGESTAITVIAPYMEGPIIDAICYQDASMDVIGGWVYSTKNDATAFDFRNFANGLISSIVTNDNVSALYKSSLNAGNIDFRGLRNKTGWKNSRFIKAFDYSHICVSANGNDDNNGSRQTPVASLSKALEMVDEGGIVELLTDIDESGTPIINNKTVRITGSYTVNLNNAIFCGGNCSIVLESDVSILSYSAFSINGSLNLRLNNSSITLSSQIENSRLLSNLSSYSAFAVITGNGSITGKGFIGYSLEEKSLCVIDGTKGYSLSGGVESTKYNSATSVLNS